MLTDREVGSPTCKKFCVAALVILNNVVNPELFIPDTAATYEFRNHIRIQEKVPDPTGFVFTTLVLNTENTKNPL